MGKTRTRQRNIDSLHIQRERANKRERERTKALNDAYGKLRKKIPSLPSDKTSKIHTLRVTIEYIHFLYEMVYNQISISNNTGLTLHEDNQINLPATFNSWRTHYNQKWHIKFMKQQQAQQRNHQFQQELSEQHPLQQLADSCHLAECSTDAYCPPEFPIFVDPQHLKPDAFMPKSRDKKVKSESEECFYATVGYGFADPNISLNCALGQAITQTQL